MNAKSPYYLRAVKPSLVGWFAVVTLVGILVVWGGFAKISGAIIAPGVIEVESQRQIVQHPTGGIVSAIQVKDGDFVSAGDILIKLDPDDTLSQHAIALNQFYEVSARVARLIAERDGTSMIGFSEFLQTESQDNETVKNLMSGQTRLFEARLISYEKESAQLEESIIQTREQILGTDAQVNAVETQITLVKQELVTTKNLLEKGLAQSSAELALRRNLAQLEGQRGALLASRGQLASTIAAAEIEKLRLESARRERAITELRDFENQSTELSERVETLARQIDRLEIKAPVSGVVLGMQVFAVNAVISPAEPVMFIVPQDQPLVVSANVPVNQIDQVFTGQEVSLRFSALDQRFTPEVKGFVRTVSADAETDQNTGERFYSTELVPEIAELEKLGDQTLIPGMPVEAYIQTGARSPINYLTKPIADYFYRAFREE